MDSKEYPVILSLAIYSTLSKMKMIQKKKFEDLGINQEKNYMKPTKSPKYLIPSQ
jgi:hypothetical protein